MATALKHLTTDEYLLWAEGREGRWELFDGVPAMMAPERAAHTRVNKFVARALDDGIVQARLPCETFTEGLTIKVGAETAFEPDASVICGPPTPDDAIAVSDPVIVVEVLSPSSAAIDHGRKLSGYFSMPSVQTTSSSIRSGASPSITNAGRATRSRRAC